MKLQCKLNSQSYTVFYLKVKSFIGKQWDPKIWDDNMCADLNKAKQLKPQKFSELPLPVKLNHPPLAEGSVMAILETLLFQRKADTPEDWPHPFSLLLDP